MTSYRVSGDREVLGHMPGDVFDADLDEIQEQRLTAGGHIERLPKRAKRENVPDDRAGEPDTKKE